MLDKLPSHLRHLALLVLATVLTWVGTEIVPSLEGEAGISSVVAVVLTMLIAWLTPLTRQYGVGSA